MFEGLFLPRNVVVSLFIAVCRQKVKTIKVKLILRCPKIFLSSNVICRLLTGKCHFQVFSSRKNCKAYQSVDAVALRMASEEKDELKMFFA